MTEGGRGMTEGGRGMTGEWWAPAFAGDSFRGAGGDGFRLSPE